MNPYKTLGIPEEASDGMIRKAYLTAIKACPPERDADRFRKLTTAYERIKDVDSRLHRIVYTENPEGSTPLEVVMEHARSEPAAPADFNRLKRFLRSLA